MEPGIPESFKVLIKELQSLALDVRVLGENDQEIELKEMSDYDAPTGIDSIINHMQPSLESEETLFDAGFSEEKNEEAEAEETQSPEEL